jgi:hypothetical protein
MWLKLSKNEQKLTKKHKPTFLIHLLRRNEEQNLPPYIFLKSGPPKSPPMEAGCEHTVHYRGKKRAIYNRQFTGGWLEKPPVEINFHWRLSLHNRQWK